MIKPQTLTVEAIFIDDGEGRSPPFRTQGYLDSLSEKEWSELRAKATKKKREGVPFLRCGDCGRQVYLRESKSKRRHCYHFGEKAEGCLWSSAHAKNFRLIDAEKFYGAQEGERHKALKRMLCEILEFDVEAKNSGITQECYTKGKSGTGYTFPDVFVGCWQGTATAFEIQLATTQLPTIVRREAFYKENNIRLIWIVDGENASLFRRTFKDIYFRNDGQILGLDDEVVTVARLAGAARFRLHRLLPKFTSEGLVSDWKTKIVSPEELNWGNAEVYPKSKNGSYDVYLRDLISKHKTLKEIRINFFESLKKNETSSLERIWNYVADISGGRIWSELKFQYDDIAALSVLASLQEGVVYADTILDHSNIVSISNTMLLEPQGRRVWSNAFEQVAKSCRPDLLLVKSVLNKINRNKSENLNSPRPEMRAGNVFNIFFPAGAFSRLIIGGVSD